MFLMDSETRARADKLRKDKWIESSMFIEAIAVKQEVVESSLEEHINKMRSIRDIFVYHTEFKESLKVEKPFKDIDEAYSMIAEIKLFAKDLFSLMTVIVLYGPSSVEVLGPNNLNVNIDEVQQIANSVADLIHQFAAAGAGGIILSQRK